MKFSTLLIFCALTIVLIESRRQYLDLDENSLKEILSSDRKLSELLKDPDLLDVLRRTLKAEKKCNVATDKPETIIKTKESQLKGAVFISAPPVFTRKECITACCANASCNTAIIKQSEDETGCYLFDCGNPNICIFSQHAGFSAVQLYPRRHTEDKPSAPAIRTTTESATMTTTSSSRPKKPTKPFNLSGLLNTSCHDILDCLGHHVDCVGGLCNCKKGFHAVGHVCRQYCGLYHFECAIVNDPERAICIPIYRKCDGKIDCPDGSDEAGCSTVIPTTQKGGPVASIPTKTGGNTTVLPSTTKSPLASSSSTTSEDGAERQGSDVKIESRVVATPVSKGAAVALALSITLVLLLTIFGACQLRRARSRSLKGRLRNPKEADYLINGMYL